MGVGMAGEILTVCSILMIWYLVARAFASEFKEQVFSATQGFLPLEPTGRRMFITELG